MKVDEILMIIIGLLSLYIFYKIYNGSLIEGDEPPPHTNCDNVFIELCGEHHGDEQECNACLNNKQSQLKQAGCDSDNIRYWMDNKCNLDKDKYSYCDSTKNQVCRGGIKCEKDASPYLNCDIFKDENKCICPYLNAPTCGPYNCKHENTTDCIITQKDNLPDNYKCHCNEGWDGPECRNET